MCLILPAYFEVTDSFGTVVLAESVMVCFKYVVAFEVAL